MREQVLRQLRALPTPQQQPHETVPLESEAFRALFPAGIRRGMLADWLCEGNGSGVESLTLKLVADVAGVLVVVDSHHNFYPPAAAAFGIALSRMIVVRPRCDNDSLWPVLVIIDGAQPFAKLF